MFQDSEQNIAKELLAQAVEQKSEIRLVKVDAATSVTEELDQKIVYEENEKFKDLLLGELDYLQKALDEAEKISSGMLG